MDLRPVSDKRLINSTLISVDKIFGSFCNPSLGPTSIILTEVCLVCKNKHFYS